jgi:hypothetical protein
MRRVLVPIVLVLLVLAGSWLVLGGEGPRPVEHAAQGGARAPTTAVERRGVDDGPPAARPRPTRSKAERDALRVRIVEALARRDGAAERKPAAEDEGPAERTKTRAGAAAEEAPASGGLVDRSGNHGYLMKVMNEDLMPLVDECYELARATNPELAGKLVLDVAILGGEDIGGVVESVAPAANNELTDPTLGECVRESLLSATLPAPPHGGDDAIMLDLRLSPDPPK